jgi:adenosylcobinamide-phosphate synthase
MAVLFISLAAVLVIDLLIGDPRWRYHPVRLLGMLCERAERLARRAERCLPVRLCGALAWIIVSGVSLALALTLLLLFSRLQPLAGLLFAAAVLYFSIAAGDLIRHARQVSRSLLGGDLGQGRRAVAMMVGRDTDALDASGVARACIESVAENLVDGVTAPIFWALVAALAGAGFGLEPYGAAVLGAVGYKAINTMDSMWGYKNERYREFGWCGARADDVASFLPARISGLAVIVAAVLLGYDGRQAARIFGRDRLQSSSPNSGQTEAAAAGALGVQLGGTASYFGTEQHKPLIGGGLRPPEAGDIERCNRLIIVAAILFTATMMIIVGTFGAVAGW